MDYQPISDDDLQGQMAAVRWALARDVLGVRDDMQTLTDWRYHFRRHPALCCAGAAALGFLAIPRRRSQQSVVTHVWQAAPATGPSPVVPIEKAAGFSFKSLAVAALSMAATAAARQASAYAQRRGQEYVARMMAERNARAQQSYEPEAHYPLE